MKPLVLATLAGLASLAAFAAPAAPPASQDSCFLTRDLRGHTIGPGGHTLYFDVNGTSVYRVSTTNGCLTGVTGSDTIVLQDRGLGKICHPLDLEIRARGNQCIIADLTKLSPAEAQALPKRLQTLKPEEKIMKRLVLSGLAVLAAATAFAAQAQPTPGGKCIYIRDLRNHTVGDDHTLYFDVGGREVYRVTTSGACLAGVSSSDPIVLRDRASTGRICDRMDWDIGVRGARCIISDVARLTPDEVKALPRRVKP